MKKLLLILASILLLSYTYAQNSTADGEWPTVVTASYTIVGGSVVNIQHVVTANQELTILFGGTLNILSDSLIVNAGLVSFIGGNLTVKEDAVLWISGDLDNSLWGDITIEGTLKVEGDVSNWGSDINVGENGSVGIGGDFNNTGGDVDIDGGGSFTVGGEIIDPNGGITGDDIPLDTASNVGKEVALPIELLYFKGHYDNNEAILSWATATEINNDYFLLEYSEDAFIWYVFDSVKGAGNSMINLYYQRIVITNKSYYYRLTQFDYNGDYEIFPLIFVQSLYLDDMREYDVYDIYGRFLRKDYKENILNYRGVYIIRYNDEVHKIMR